MADRGLSNNEHRWVAIVTSAGEMALGCDIRVASDNAQMGLDEVRLGLLPGGGGTQRRPQTIALGDALWMLYAGERIGADRFFFASRRKMG